MPSSESGEPRSAAWPRRRFLGAIAAAGAGVLAGPLAPEAAPIVDPGPDPTDPPPAAAAGSTEIEPDLPIRGSPRLLSTGLPPHGLIDPWLADQARLIHFQLAGRDRDRLLLGLP
jgi:hypothetical protein